MPVAPSPNDALVATIRRDSHSHLAVKLTQRSQRRLHVKDIIKQLRFWKDRTFKAWCCDEPIKAKLQPQADM